MLSQQVKLAVSVCLWYCEDWPSLHWPGGQAVSMKFLASPEELGDEYHTFYESGCLSFPLCSFEW